jgi:outer membrane immunogenic protein
MKKIIILCASAAAVAAFATPASAAVKTGGRIEAITGYDRVSIDAGSGVNVDASGVTFGVGAGYDFAAGKKVALGLDVEATLATTDLDPTPTDSVKAKRDLYAGGRLTTALSDKVNLYFKAGYTNARFSATSGGVSAAGNLDGVRGGAGLQFAIGKSAYIGGEYRYSNYESDVTRHQGVLALGVRF